MARILIIDDEDLVRFTLRQILERTGHEVLEAENGRQGIALHRASPADVIITDIIMPEQEGVETIIELRRDYPAVEIIAVSGGGRIGSREYLELARKFGARHVFAKPFDQRELLRAVDETLAATVGTTRSGGQRHLAGS